jgi:hypothetical protein
VSSVSSFSDDTLVRTLCREASEALADLGFHGRFTLGALIERIAERRGRPLHLMPHSWPSDGPHGLWVATDIADYLAFDQYAAPLRRFMIIGHELAHMAYGDEGTPVESVAGLLPEGTFAARVKVRSVVCMRSVHDDLVEQRAEWFATVVGQSLDFGASHRGAQAV